MSNLLTVDQGDDEILDIACKTAAGEPYPLTGTKLWFYVKKNTSDTDANALIKKTTEVGEGITVTDAVGGIAEVQLLPSDTSGLASAAIGRTLSWQLQAKDGANRVTTLAKGDFIINRDLVQASA